jgi:hypothetical protein
MTRPLLAESAIHPAIDLANDSPMQLLKSANIAQLMHDGANALQA